MKKNAAGNLADEDFDRIGHAGGDLEFRSCRQAADVMVDPAVGGVAKVLAGNRHRAEAFEIPDGVRVPLVLIVFRRDQAAGSAGGSHGVTVVEDEAVVESHGENIIPGTHEAEACGFRCADVSAVDDEPLPRLHMFSH